MTDILYIRRNTTGMIDRYEVCGKHDMGAEPWVPKAKLDAVKAELAALETKVKWLTSDVDALRAALSKAREQDRDPDYCHDEDWDYTYSWSEFPDLVDGHDLAEPTPIYTLYKGPTKWVVRVPTGEDSEVRIFDSEEDACAALGSAT